MPAVPGRAVDGTCGAGSVRNVVSTRRGAAMAVPGVHPIARNVTPARMI